MPLEIWILLMTFFNVFLVITYLYYRTLHLNAKSNLESSILGLEKRVINFENNVIRQLKKSGGNSSFVEDSDDVRNRRY